MPQKHLLNHELAQSFMLCVLDARLWCLHQPPDKKPTWQEALHEKRCLEAAFGHLRALHRRLSAGDVKLDKLWYVHENMHPAVKNELSRYSDTEIGRRYFSRFSREGCDREGL